MTETRQADRSYLGERFAMYLLLGMITPMAVLFTMFHYGYRGYNAFLTGAEITLAICLALPTLFNLIYRKSFKRLIKCVLTMLFTGFMFSGMFVFIAANEIYYDYQDAPDLAAFAQKDFAQIDSTGTGVVTYAQLDAITKEQEKVKADQASLAQAEQAIESTSTGKGAKELAKLGLLGIELELKAKQRPDDQLQRIYALKYRMGEAGHNLSSKPAKDADVTDYGTTRDELNHFQSKLEATYPEYFWMLRKFGAIK